MTMIRVAVQKVQQCAAVTTTNGPSGLFCLCRRIGSAGTAGSNTSFLRALSTGESPLHHHHHYQLNVNKALKKNTEGQYLNDLIGQPSTTLQGIGPKHAEQLSELGLSTIQQLAEYKYFHLARSLVTLASVEEMGGRRRRVEESTMNVNHGLDKDFEHLSFTEMILQPVHALQGITPTRGEIFASLGVKTIEDLANFKYCKWAEALQVAAKFEERK